MSVPKRFALATRLVALMTLLSALTRAEPQRMHLLRQLVPGTLVHLAAAVTALAGVLLLLLAHGLARRKRRAWTAVVVLLSVSSVLHLAKGLDVEEAVVSLLLIALLVLFRKEFRAVSDPRTRWVVAQAVSALLLLSLGVGFLLVRIRLGGTTGSRSLSMQLQQVLWGLIGVDGPLQYGRHGDHDVVSFTLAGLGITTVLVTAYLMLRPAEPLPVLSADDETRLRQLLDQHGADDSLGYFNLRHDKSVVWSASGKAAVAYRVVSGVALASGNPLGDSEAWPGAIAAFQQLADQHAWVPAVLGCGERAGRAWTRAGLEVLEIGDEAVVDVDAFSLEGRAMRTVRQAVGRLRRAGYVVQVRRTSDLSPDEVADVRRAVQAWRDSDTERGFSMALGRFGDVSDPRCVLVSATLDGELRAVLHYVPWGCDGLSLDVMRRDRSADNGLNELLIVSTLEAAPALGVRRVSLNFAVFRQALESGERLGAGPILRTWRGVLVLASRWFQIDSLYRFNAKFRPVWEPRYLCYPGAGDLPRVMIAALEAEAFLVWPRLAQSRRARSLAISGRAPISSASASARSAGSADPIAAASSRSPTTRQSG